MTKFKKQFEFSEKENAKTRGFKKDPVGDREAGIESGILHKYKGRLLVMASNKCAAYCRFCFRRNMQKKSIPNLPEKLREILKKDKSIKEVILSGGDPLMLGNNELQAFFDVIPKPLKIRIHSRMATTRPSRFTPALQSLFKQLGSRLIFVAHINHPDELNKDSEKIFRNLSKYGATLLNQNVLLRGINDSAKILAELSEKLFSQRVLPYYLHQLDKAQGTAHFEVPIKRAKEIFKELKELLPGYLVPRFVREIKGRKSKVWISTF
ncbi:MAG: KamA family radical SAM protein [Candidatus Fibromonas sp.]|jgi:KamA family protein|nr:KamA family radical SAM protein [Candidatus Fibromonas sp.]